MFIFLVINNVNTGTQERKYIKFNYSLIPTINDYGDVVIPKKGGKRRKTNKTKKDKKRNKKLNKSKKSKRLHKHFRH
jgi:hypothetical protein